MPHGIDILNVKRTSKKEQNVRIIFLWARDFRNLLT